MDAPDPAPPPAVAATLAAARHDDPTRGPVPEPQSDPLDPFEPVNEPTDPSGPDRPGAGDDGPEPDPDA